MSLLVDRYGREHTYLRISVTDRCNLRCVYCMPSGAITWKRREQLLSYEEIVRVASVLVDMGISKIRITGGEPLVRRDLEKLVFNLSQLPGLRTLAMTTNAVLLKDKATVLKEAGLKALNISLDSLKRDKFQEITKRDDWDEVMSGIRAALDAEFESLKLNCVVMANYNDDEILDFVDYIKDKPMNIRFIEYMPFPDNNWHKGKMFPYQEMKRLIEEHYRLIPIEQEPGAVARDFAIEGQTGTVSFITSMSDSFCSTCNRLRLTADGSIKSCLFYEPERNLRDLMRDGITDDELRNLIYDAVLQKPEAHPPMEELVGMANRTMVEIGG
jgi:cyclic pyranopterin phosphate synthase